MILFESIIHNAIKESMSDIHITGEHPVVSRKQGDIQFNSSLKWTHQEIDNLTRKLLTPLQLERLRQKNPLILLFPRAMHASGSTFSPQCGE